MSGNTKVKPITGFYRGFTYPFSSIGFLKSYPALLKYIVIPFCINVVVFCLVVYFGFSFFQETVLASIPQADAWYWFLLNYFLLALGVLVTLGLIFFTFTVVGCLIASPFNDILSERTEEILSGEIKEAFFSWSSFISDAKRTVLNESKKIGVFVAGMILLLLLNLLPGLGTMLYSVLSILWVIFFLIVEYTGYSLARKRMLFAEQRRLVLSRFTMMFGFGCALFCLLTIPFFQFMTIPLGVVGATRMLENSGMLKELGD